MNGNPKKGKRAMLGRWVRDEFVARTIIIIGLRNLIPSKNVSFFSGRIFIQSVTN